MRSDRRTARLVAKLRHELEAPGCSFSERMSTALPVVTELTGGDQSNLFVLPDPRSDLPASELITHAMDPLALDAYTAHYSQFDPCIAFGLRSPNTPHRLSDFLSPRQFRKNPHTAEHMSRAGLRWTMGVSLRLPHDLFLCMGFHRRVSLDDFEAHEVAAFGLLAIDLGAFAFRSLIQDRIHRELSSADAAEVGVIVVAARGVESQHGRAGEILSSLEDPTWLLSRALAGASSHCARTRTWAARRRDGGWVRATTLPPFDTGAQRSPGSAAVLLELLSPGSWAFMRAELHRARLTPREEQVAIEAVQGTPVGELAAGLSISPSTAKHHLTRVYAKMGVSGRSELVALARGLLVRSTDDLDRSLARTPLTRREREVVVLALGGAGNQEIARRLGLSLVTVKLHLRSVYRKSNTSNRATLAALLLGKR